MTKMEFFEKILIPLGSAVLGAILAFKYQNFLELRRDKRVVLQNLMIYRNVTANELDWVKSLNAIDLVFHENEKIRELYHTFLNETMKQPINEDNCFEILYKLIYEMAKDSGYKKLRLTDIRNFYSPESLMSLYPNMNLGKEPPPAVSNV